MIIDDYSFGRISIDGKVYTRDVIIYPDRVEGPWWRVSGHSVTPGDLADIVEAGPEVVIFGTGNSGVMKVPDEARRFLEEKGIEVYAYRTPEAVRLFNESPKCHAMVLALHLTC